MTPEDGKPFDFDCGIAKGLPVNTVRPGDCLAGIVSDCNICDNKELTDKKCGSQEPTDGVTVVTTACNTGNITFIPGVSPLPGGPSFIVGLQGSNGVNGTQGVTGEKGDPGVTGAKGDTGAAGSTGATGAKGATGATGAKGATGATGATGAVDQCEPKCPAGSICSANECFCPNTGFPVVKPESGKFDTNYRNEQRTTTYELGAIPLGDKYVRRRAGGTPATRRLQRSRTDADALPPSLPSNSARSTTTAAASPTGTFSRPTICAPSRRSTPASRA